MWAVVPLKSPDSAKSRLAGVLAPAERRALFFAMAEHVLRALRQTPAIERVLVVTASGEVESFARALEAQVLREPSEAGTAQACNLALASGLVPADAPMLFVSGDLPLLSSAAIQGLLARALPAPSIVVAPDHRREGTNALWCSHAGLVPPCFGAGSFARHTEEARARRAAVAIHEAADLALDIDDAADLQRLQSSGDWKRWLERHEALLTS